MATWATGCKEGSRRKEGYVIKTILGLCMIWSIIQSYKEYRRRNVSRLGMRRGSVPGSLTRLARLLRLARPGRPLCNVLGPYKGKWRA